jgi:hypothetical protein
MGKIVASYLLKVHLHEGVAIPVEASTLTSESSPEPTNDEVKGVVITALEKEFGGEATVSLIERTDID